MSTNSKISKWIQTLFLVLAEEGLDESIFPANGQKGLKNEARTVETFSEQMRKTTFSPVLVASNIRNMTTENQDCFRRSSDAPKCYACVEKPIAVMIVKVRSVNLAVKD